MYTNGILERIAGYALTPIYLLIKLKTAVLELLKQALIALRDFFNYISKNISDIVDYFYNLFREIISPFIKIVNILSDFGSKTVGIIYTIYYFFIAFVKSIFLFFHNLKNIIIEILKRFAELIGITFAIGFGLAASLILSFLAPPVLMAAVAMVILMIIIIIPTLMLISFTGRVLDQRTQAVPDVPSCFSGNTIIELNNGKTKLFKDLKIGDILKNEAKVTTLFKCSSYKQDIYKLNNILNYW